jgi:hypothetical protein
MVKINMAVTVDTVEELLEALKSAGPNVASFYGEVRGYDSTEAARAIRDVASKPEADPEPEAPAAEPTPVYTMTQVREALAKVRLSLGGDGMRDILRKFGAEKLAEVDASKYPAIMEDIEAVMKEAENAC